MVLLRVIEKENYPERGSPYFAQIKPKTNQVRFLSELINLNNQLRIKPYPLPTIVLKLEAFKYAALLYLNMRYYHIQHSEKSSTLLVCIIIPP